MSVKNRIKNSLDKKRFRPIISMRGRSNHVRDAERIDRLLEKLRIIWHVNQDQRLGQLISNLYRWDAGATPSLFNIEDDKWEDMIDKKLLDWDKGIKSGNGNILFRDRCWLVTKDGLYED